MKTWPPLRDSAAAPPPRVPAFHPVPVGSRRDGCTPRRPAAFVGKLDETGAVQAACRALSMGRESVYRLRRRAGAAGFAAAWDAALGKPHRAVDLSCAKSTGLDAAYRSRMGLLEVVMERGRFLGSHWHEDENASREHHARSAESARGDAARERKPHRRSMSHVSGGSVDFAAAPAASPALPGLGEPLADQHRAEALAVAGRRSQQAAVAVAVPAWRSGEGERALIEQMLEEERRGFGQRRLARTRRP